MLCIALSSLITNTIIKAFFSITTVLRYNKKVRSMEVDTLSPNLPVPPLTRKDLPPPAEVVAQHPSQEALELPDKEERRGIAKRRRQTQTVADVETPVQTQLYAVPTGEGYFSEQTVVEMLASIHAAIARSVAGTSVQVPAFAHPTAHC